MLEAELVNEGVSAATSGNVGLFGQLIDGIDRGIQTAIINASTAGQLHVELEKLTTFYNTLATLHYEHLAPQMIALHGRAAAAGQTQAGGHVPGVQAAWQAITQSAGAMDSANSLYGNLKAVDDLVLYHMQSLLETAQQYAAQENRAIAKFDSVSAGQQPAASSPSTSW